MLLPCLPSPGPGCVAATAWMHSACRGTAARSPFRSGPRRLLYNHAPLKARALLALESVCVVVVPVCSAPLPVRRDIARLQCDDDEMGHHSCCNKQKVRRGLWSPEEDEKLVKYITAHGHGCWSSVPRQAGTTDMYICVRGRGNCLISCTEAARKKRSSSVQFNA